MKCRLGDGLLFKKSFDAGSLGVRVQTLHFKRSQSDFQIVARYNSGRC